MSDFWKAPSGLVVNLDSVVRVQDEAGDGSLAVLASGVGTFFVDGDEASSLMAAIDERIGERAQVAEKDYSLYAQPVGVVPVLALSPEAAPVVESLRGLLAKLGFGVTLQGAHLTVRWRGDWPTSGDDRRLLQVTMIVDEVDDGRDYDLGLGGT